MSKLRNRVIALTLSVLTALSTVAGSIPAYAAGRLDGTPAAEDSSKQDNSGSADAVINLRVDSMGGSLVVNEGQADEQTITVDEDGKTILTDADGYETVASVSDGQPYDLILKEETGTTVNVKAVSNDGYQVSLYAVSTDSGAQDVGFTPCRTFTYNVVAEGTKTIETSFWKTGEDAVSGTEEITSSDESTEDVEESEPAAEADMDFSSARLLVGTSDESVVAPDSDKVLSSYEGVYLIQYDSAGEAETAYKKYQGSADFVDADTAEIKTADDADIKDVSSEEMTEESNPIAFLADAAAEAEGQAESDGSSDNLIALIDTGATVGGNVVEAVSMLGEDTRDNNGHGTDMVRYIASENPKAKILSIKALDKNGKGTPSSIYAAIKYAMERKVSVINLSLSGVKTADNSAIADIVKEAVQDNITVIGAAGNNGRDAKYYIPGGIDEAVIAGAVESDGCRLSASNYGDTVDYYVAAASTSEAAARLTGIFSKTGSIKADDKKVLSTAKDPKNPSDDGNGGDPNDIHVADGGSGSAGAGSGSAIGNANGYYVWHDYGQGFNVDVNDPAAVKQNEDVFRENWVDGFVLKNAGLTNGMNTVGYNGVEPYLSLYNRAAEAALKDAAQRSGTTKARIVGAIGIYTVGRDGKTAYPAYGFTKDQWKTMTNMQADHGEGLYDDLSWGAVRYNNDDPTVQENWRDWLFEYGTDKVTDFYHTTVIVYAVAENEPPQGPQDGYLKIHKSSSNPELTDGKSYYSFEGARYGVWKNKECTDSAGVTFTLGADGNSNIEKLPVGTYYIKEEKAPKGYKKSDQVYSVNVTAGSTADKPVVLEVTDEPDKLADPGSLLIQKNLENGATATGGLSLNGAQFSVQYWPEILTRAQLQQQNYKNAQNTWTFKTDTYEGKEGFINFVEPKFCTSKPNEPEKGPSGIYFYYEGTYYIKEISAPSGYIAPEEGLIAHVEIQDDGTAKWTYVDDSTNIRSGIKVNRKVVSVGQTPDKTVTTWEIWEPAGKGGIEFKKTDAETSSSTAQGDASLAGAKVGVYYIGDDDITCFAGGSDGTQGTEGGAHTVKKGGLCMTLTTDENGYANTGFNLMKGKYQLREITPSEGYHNNNKDADGEIRTFLDGSSQSLWEPIVEITDNDDYEKNGNKYVNKDVDGHSLLAGNDNSLPELVIRGGVSLQKINDELHTNKNQGDETLKNAKIAVVNASKEAVYIQNTGTKGVTYNGADTKGQGGLIPTIGYSTSMLSRDEVIAKEKAAGARVLTLTTDEDGFVTTNARDLPYGTYYMYEEQPSTGYHLNTDWCVRFEIRHEGVITKFEKNVGDSDVKADTNPEAGAALTQKPIRFDIKWRKVDEDGKPMGSIPFAIEQLKTDGEGNLLDEDGNRVTDPDKAAVLEWHVAVTNKYGEYSTKWYTRRDDQGNFLDADGNIVTDEAAARVRKEYWNTNGKVNEYDHDYELGMYSGTHTFTYKGVQQSTDADNIVFFGDSTEGHQYSAVPGEVHTSNDHGALPYGTYRIVELQKDAQSDSSNRGRDLISSSVFTLHAGDNTEIDLGTYTNVSPHLTSEALETTSKTHTVPVGKNVEIKDRISYSNVHEYKDDVNKTEKNDYYILSTVVDYDDPTHIIGTNYNMDKNGKGDVAGLEANGSYVLGKFFGKLYTKDELNKLLYHFQPKATTGQHSNIVHGSIDDLVYKIDTTDLEGKRLLVQDYLFKRLPSGQIVCEGVHTKLTMSQYFPSDAEDEYFEETTVKDQLVLQSLFVPKLSTRAFDGLSYDRTGTKNAYDSIYDRVKVYNLAADDDYAVKMAIVDKNALVKAVESNAKDITVVDADGRNENSTYIKVGDQYVLYQTGGGSTKLPAKYIVSQSSSNNKSSSLHFKVNSNDDDENIGLDNPKIKAKDSFDRIYAYDGSLNDTVHTAVNSEKFTGNQSVVVIEQLYRADSQGRPISGSMPIVTHMDVDDEDQTIRYPDITSDAADINTGDDVGNTLDRSNTNVVTKDGFANGKKQQTTTVTDTIKITNLAFGDTENHETWAGSNVKKTYTYEDSHGRRIEVNAEPTDYYEYTLTGLPVFQKDWIAAKDLTWNGRDYKVGDLVAKEGDPVPVSSASRVQIHFTINNVGEITDAYYMLPERLGDLWSDSDYDTVTRGLRESWEKPSIGVRGETLNSDDISYDPETRTLTCRLSYTFDSTDMADASIVCFAKLNHDAYHAINNGDFGITDLVGDNEVDVHDIITDENQDVHFPDIHTTANDGYTMDDVGTVTVKSTSPDGGNYTQDLDQSKNLGTIVDTVELNNLVPGRTYTVKGILMDQDTEKVFLVNGKPVTQETTFTVSAVDEDGNVTISGTTTGADGKEVSLVKGTVNTDRKDAGNPKAQYVINDVNAEKHEVDGTVDLIFYFDSTALENKTVVAYEDLWHNGTNVVSHRDITDKSQTVHYPEIRTKAIDQKTGDHVGTEAKDDTIVDTVSYWNLVKGREYTVKGRLVYKEDVYSFDNEGNQGKKLHSKGDTVVDSAGKQVTAERIFTAGETETGITALPRKDGNSYDGTVDITFRMNMADIENVTTVAYEYLYHNGVNVTSHEDITDEAQAEHYPMVRTTAADGYTPDEVGTVTKYSDTCPQDAENQKNMGTITDRVKLWNLLPDMTYTIDGTLMDKDTGKELLTSDGQKITASAAFTVEKSGSTYVLSTANGEESEVTAYDKENNRVDGWVDLVFTFDTTDFEDKTAVAFETLKHNDIDISRHTDINDLGETVHYPKVRTSAFDLTYSDQDGYKSTKDHVGTIDSDAVFKDIVTFRNLVIGKTYTMTGTLMNQKSGAALVGADGKEISASSTFKVQAYDKDGKAIEPTSYSYINGEIAEVKLLDADGNELDGYSIDKDQDAKNHEVNGKMTLTFTLDTTALKGQTVVAFEKLYYNGINITSHADLTDKEQSVHYPDLHTMAADKETGDHAGSIFGALINGVRKLFGDKDADGNGITDDRQANIVDTVKLENLVPGNSYVVAGELHYGSDCTDADGSAHKKGDVVLIDGKKITQSTTITVAENSIKDANGNKTTVTNYDADKQQVDGTVDLTFSFDSSKVKGSTQVVYERMYHTADFTADTKIDDIPKDENGNPKTPVITHENPDDKEQSVNEVDIHTALVDTKTGDKVGAVPNDSIDGTSTLTDTVNMEKLVKGYEYKAEGVLVDMTNSDFENGKILYLTVSGEETTDVTKALTVTKNFTAEAEKQTITLDFSIQNKDVQGKAVTVFENLYHNGKKIASHPAKNETNGTIDWDKEEFKNQSVYYPTGKTNATDDTTSTHTSLAGKTEITDKVYFDTLLLDKDYEVNGHLVYQSDFTDKNGKTHKAGETIEGVTDSAKLNFTLGEDGKVVLPKDEEISDVKVTEQFDGTKTVSGYVNLHFSVDTSLLEGATTVAFEDVSHNNVTVFVHENLNDTPQFTRIPALHTNASVEDLDEAAVYDKDGKCKDITITDIVSYKNLWTPEMLKELHEKGLNVTTDGHVVPTAQNPVYDINENGVYTIRGTLMDKKTGKALVNKNGETYTSYVTFTPEKSDGEVEVSFTLNGNDFAKDENGYTALEGKTLVVFEDLYQADGEKNIDDKTNHIGEHHDIDDHEQDIRLPKGRTHALDSQDVTEVSDSKDSITGIISEHAGELTTTGHEVDAAKTVTITDRVAYSKLHGGVEYTLTGELHDKATGEILKDDDGKEITATVTFTPEGDYDDEVSGYVDLTFTFPAETLAGKTAVAFETCTREGKDIFVHHDLKDQAETVYFPELHTNASDLLTGINEGNAGKTSYVVDKISYKNLEKGKTYTVKGVLHQKSSGEELSDTKVEGKFVAGTDGQIITKDGTLSGTTIEDLRKNLKDEKDLYSKTDAKTLTDEPDQSTAKANADAAVKKVETFDSTTDTAVTKTETQTVTKVEPVIDTKALADKTKEILNTYSAKKAVAGKDVKVGVYRATANNWNGSKWGYVRVLDANGHVLVAADVNGDEKVFISAAEGQTIEFFNVVVRKVKEQADNEGKILTKTDKADAVVKADDEKVKAITDSLIAEAKAQLIKEAETKAEEAEKAAQENAAKAEIETSNVTGSNRIDGYVYMLIPVDSSELAGDTVVAFETLMAKNDKGEYKQIAHHENINDEDQSVHYPKIQTEAKVDGAKSVTGSKNTTLTDTISYENLTPGREYTAKGVLMNKATGESIGIASDAKFTPEKADGTTDVTFTFDSSNIQGDLVVFEELVTQNPDTKEVVKVAEHKDLNDASQTVTIMPPAVTGTPTGDQPVWPYAAGAAAAIVLAAAVIAGRKKRKDTDGDEADTEK